MNTSGEHPLTQRILRTTDAFELVLFDRLSDKERRTFESMAEDPDFYGVLKPRQPGPSWKAVDRDTALLLWTLGEAGPLPGYLWRSADRRQRLDEVLRLVADGVLAIESEGALLTPAEALQSLGTTRDEGLRGRLSELSWQALEWAAALGRMGADDLAKRLYRFGQLPLTPTWEHRLPNAEAVLEWLALEPGTSLRRSLEGSWRIQLGKRPRDWISLFRRRQGETTNPNPGGRRWKLYLSPAPGALPDAVATLVGVLSEGPCDHFKLGGGAVDLLRPDKCVLYFDRYADLAETAEKLYGAFIQRSQGPPAVQGVPFTAEIDSAGLLSWGLDPPADQRWLDWQSSESWRSWLVRRLALFLAEAIRRGEPPAGAARFALDRLALEGVDTLRWLPAETPGQELL